MTPHRTGTISMPITTQSRSINYTPPKAKYWLNGVPQNAETGIGYSLSQTTRSFRGSVEGDREREDGRSLRRRFRSEAGNRSFDNGNEFFTTRTSVKTAWEIGRLTGSMYYGGKYGEVVYQGVIDPRSNPATSTLPRWSLHPSLSITQIMADGRKLIKATTPTTPEVSLAAMLGELKEKLPQVIGHSIGKKGSPPGKLGGEYLNVEFGIKPLANDIAQLALNVSEASKLIRQFRRDSDKVVRRRAELATDVSTVTHPPVTSWLGLPRMNFADANGLFYDTSVLGMTFSDKHTTDVWFSGAYQYHLAEADSFLGKLEQYEQLANNLLGSRITLDTVYQLTPWSWLFDWFGDFGTFVSNVTALHSDSLVLRYAYVMHQQVSERTCNMVIKPVPSIPANMSHTGKPIVTGGISSCFSIGTRVSKTRTRATPYGFGLDVEKFSPRQWAILGALGLTKSDRKLGSSG